MFAYVMLTVLSLFHCSDLVISLSSVPNETALLRDLLDTSGYDVRVRPPTDTTTNITIIFQPKQIVRIIETSDEVEVLVNMKIRWKDERLQFNGLSYGISGTEPTKVIIPAVNLWSPPLTVTNSIGSTDSLLDTTRSYASFDLSGLVDMNVRATFRFLCALDITFYPYDKQKCILNLNIETYEKKYVTLSKISVGMDLYEDNTLWTLLSCEASLLNSQSDESERMALNFNVKREWTLHSLIDILPPIALTFLATTVFLIPAESGEKLSFAVAIFLTDAVYVTYIAGLTPRTASSYSYFLLYLILTLVMCAAAVFMAAIVIWLNDREEQGSTLKQCCCLPRRRVSAKSQSPSGDGLTKRKTVARKMDFICFILHGVAAVAITIGIFAFLTL